MASEVLKQIESMADLMTGFQESHTKELDAIRSENVELKSRIELIEAGADRPHAAGVNKTEEVKRFEAFVRTGEKSGLKTPDTKEMSIVGGASSGGAMVPEVIASQIISRAIARSRLAGMVRNTPASSSDYVRLVNLRGAVASWSSETGTRNASGTPSLREVRPTHGELYSYPSFTRWLAEDSQFDVSRFVTENVSDEFAKSLENAILLGDGSNKLTGILDTPPVSTEDGASPERDADTIQFVSGTSDLADDIISLYFSLKPEYRANAQWLLSSATLAVVRKLRDADGSGFLWQVNLSAGVDAADGLLLGKRVAISEYMAATATSPLGDPILCGDFDAGYELVRIGGMVLIRDDVTTPGKIKLYVAQRFGGRLTDNDAIKALRA
jgi:HK97 family phage major capsid protein